MRIISGTAKGSKLKAPHGLDTRPTTDRVKESLFNILRDVVDQAMVLDLFAGTGSLGLEALSRGARHAVFIDQSIASISMIKVNAAHTKLTGYTELYKGDVLKALDKLAAAGRTFDLIFCDPPYNKGYAARVLAKLSTGLVSEQGIVVLEHSRHENIDDHYNQLFLKRSERYGETVIRFFIQKSQQTAEAED